MSKIGNFFPNPRISELEAQRANVASELVQLESDGDYLALLRAEKIRNEVVRAKRIIADIDDNIRCEQALSQPPMDPRIVSALRWADAEKVRTSRELRTSGAIKRSIFGGAKGVLETNSKKINARIAALDHAIRKLEKLKAEDDLDAEIGKIQAGIPLLDVSTETVECSAAFAGSMQG